MAFYLTPGESPHQTVDKFPILEEKHGRNTPYRVLRSGERIFIHIELCNLDPACIL